MRAGILCAGAVLIALATVVLTAVHKRDLNHRALERVSDLRKSCFPHEVCDPCTPAELLGITPGKGNDKGSLIFQECHRDDSGIPLLSEDEQLTVVHEIGHQFGLGHSSGVMSPSHITTADRFNGSDLKTVRANSQSPGRR